MAVKYHDYYETLGVARDASQQDIQRAYRRLARKYHPDMNKDRSAAEQFTKIGEAYEVLKDPEKRKRYDALGENWKEGQEFRPPPGWENVHFDYGAGRGAGGKGFSFQPGGQFSDFFESLFGGAGGFENIFSQMGGQRPSARAAGPFAAGTATGREHATEQQVELTIPLEQAYRGTTRSIEVQGPGGRKTLDVKIPAGAVNGSKIRLRGEGLILKIAVAPHPQFQLHGHDLTTDVRLAPSEAALGAKIDVPTLEGTIQLSIPPGAQSGQRLRLRGKGMPRRDKPHGDLFVRVMVVVPKTLSDDERTLYEKLREVSKFNPRG